MATQKVNINELKKLSITDLMTIYNNSETIKFITNINVENILYKEVRKMIEIKIRKLLFTVDDNN